MCKRATLFLAAALSAVPPAWAAPAPEPGGGARRKLEGLKKRLPAIVAAWAKERWYDSAAVEVKSVHLLGPAEAKVNFLSRDVGGRAGGPARMRGGGRGVRLRNTDGDEVFTIYLRYYDGQWTASRLEASWDPTGHWNSKAVRFLMVDIDSANGK
jgi:hypothetical protein